MSRTFHLPAVGDTMVEGEIVEWFVAVGDTVSLDQAICSLETDKSVVEMTTPFAGTVLHLGADAGQKLAVGQALVIVGEPGEVVELEESAQRDTDRERVSPETEKTLPHSADPTSASTVRSPILRRLADELGVDLATLSASGHAGQVTRADIEAAAHQPSLATTPRPGQPQPPGPVRAMPKVRKAARTGGVDLAAIRGTGPNGAVRMEDLSAPNRTAATSPSDQRIRMSSLRRSIAAHLTESTTTIPQFTANVDVDLTGLLATRSALEKRNGRPIPLDALVVHLLIPVLRDHPAMNAQLDRATDEIVLFSRYDIGIAVDTPDGLIVPVLRSAETKSVVELADEVLSLAEAARARRIAPDQIRGATCTVNNVGAVGLESGTPILPVGNSAIVGLGRGRPRVRLNNGSPIEVLVMTISATFDHRIVDGGDAGRFLTQLRDHLEVPALGTL